MGDDYVRRSSAALPAEPAERQRPRPRFTDAAASEPSSPTAALALPPEQLARVVEIMTSVHAFGVPYSGDVGKDKRIIIPRRFDDLVRSTLFLELMNALLEHLQENVINQDEERWNVYHRTGTRRQSVHVNLTQESQTMKTFAEKYALILLKNMHWDQGMQGDQNFFESFYFIVHRLALAVAKERLRPATYERTYLELDKEIGRIFRSETFNHAKRQQVLGMKAKKESTEKPKTLSEMVDRIAQGRKENAKIKASLRREPKVSVKRNGDARSPLISLILPSPKEAIRRLEEQRRKTVSLARERAATLTLRSRTATRTRTSGGRDERKWSRKTSVVPEDTFDSW